VKVDPSAPAQPGHRSTGIDLLRGVAILIVMLAHLPFSVPPAVSPELVYPPPAIARVMALGHYGVQLFLVISGYCIHMRWARSGDPAQRLEFFAFWRRRLTRLYPPFLLVLVLSIATVIVGHQVGPGSAISWSRLGVDVTSLLLLVQNASDASAHVGNPPLWSLALEEHLYLLYFPLLFLRRTRGWATALFVSFATFCGWLALGRSLHLETSWPQSGNMAFGYWFCWALGALAAEGHVKLVRLPSAYFCVALFAGGLIVASRVDGPVRDFVTTTSFFALVVAVTRFEESGGLARLPGAKALAALGTMSYGVYLVHNPVFIVVKRLLVAIGLPAPVVLVLRFASGVMAGYLLYRMVESPFQRRSQLVPVRFVRDRASSQVVARAGAP